MLPHNEFRIHERIVQIGCYWGQGGHTELYLVEGDTLAIIDTGVANTPVQYIAPALASYGRSLADVELILNTHAHFDHAGGNSELVAATGGRAKTWLHEADAPVLSDLDLQFATYFERNQTLAGHAERLPAARADFFADAGVPPSVDHLLTDGEVIELGRGVRLRVVSVPGHTPGSVCYHWESEGIGFCGDSALGLGTRVGGLPLIFAPAQYIASMELLFSLGFRMLALGHHYRTPAAWQTGVPRDSVHMGADVANYLKSCSRISEEIGAAVALAQSARPAGDFLEVARWATDLLGPVLGVMKGDDGLAPSWGVPAIDAELTLQSAG